MSQWKKSSPELIEKFLGYTQQLEDIEPKKMFGYPCCFLNGNMFTGLHEENWIVRLPEEDRLELIDAHHGAIFAPMGRVMKEYVVLPQSVLNDPEMLKAWLERSHRFAKTLPRKLPKLRR